MSELFSQGLVSFVSGISEEEISAVIKKYRKRFPRSKRKNTELRPFAINEVLYSRKEGKV